jgi:hypothetical protein
MTNPGAGMTSITIELPEEQVQQLQQRAADLGFIKE